MNISKQFIAIDGPNGVGKSTVITSLQNQLSSKNLDFILTKEPTNSQLGNFIRANQNQFFASTLAALVVADRYDHIDKLITPNLNDGKIVITDRYIASSLVYQVIDGLDYDFILSINSHIVLPSSYFILTANHNTLSDRLKGRSQLTRFETIEDSDEGKLFQEAGDYLKQQGVNVYFIENEFRSSDETAREIMNKIIDDLSV